MARRNRVDPWGDLHAVAARGLFTGNRGCLVDDRGQPVRHHRGDLWITCVTVFRGRRHPLDDPRRWTPLFFLDEAVALAAGHRPCGECRHDAYRSYRGAVAASLGREPGAVSAGDLNRQLAAERLARGRGLSRWAHRRLWTAQLDDLPAGTVVAEPAAAATGGPPPTLLVGAGTLQPFGFGAWGPTRPRPTGTGLVVEVLTPPTSVAALHHGYRPVLHPSAVGGSAA